MKIKKLLPLFLVVLFLAGCATTVRYFPYTSQRFVPKDKYYFVTIFPGSQHPPSSQTYTVIGKVQVSGHMSDGVTPQSVIDEAKAVARKKGADAVINVKTENFVYNGTYVVPSHVSYNPILFEGRHSEGVVYVEHYHPARYYPYVDTVVTFDGDLIVFTPDFSKDNK